ncbi:helix-turn-helix domain-containing protein [Nocardioides sp. R1-1]|uniref:helix-turn-helix domain-containing protein n=1 Tax=Nocardioides sp. R1-1 TaxID=3383502 RepID=UPI0038CFE5EC
MEIDVKEASRRLGVNDSRVRQLLRAGELRGRRVGNSWAIPAEDVARLQRRGRRPGRPLAAKRAWAVLDLLEGGPAAWLSDSARSQVRRYLADLVDPGADGWLAALRGRSRVLEVVAHPAAIERLRRVDGVWPTGPSAAAVRGFDLVALAEPIPQFYLAEEQWPALSHSLALREGAEPRLVVRLPREVWPFAEGRLRGVGDAVLAADLLEAAEPRAVAAGAACLSELLDDWRRARSRA